MISHVVQDGTEKKYFLQYESIVNKILKINKVLPVKYVSKLTTALNE